MNELHRTHSWCAFDYTHVFLLLYLHTSALCERQQGVMIRLKSLITDVRSISIALKADVNALTTNLYMSYQEYLRIINNVHILCIYIICPYLPKNEQQESTAVGCVMPAFEVRLGVRYIWSHVPYLIPFDTYPRDTLPSGYPTPKVPISLDTLPYTFFVKTLVATNIVAGANNALIPITLILSINDLNIQILRTPVYTQ